MDAQPAVHPTDETLAAYGLGKADTATSDAVLQHLERCPDCRQRVAELSNDSFAGRLRSAAPDRTGRPRKSLAGVGRGIKTPPPDRSARPAFGRPPDGVPPELAGSGQYADIREIGRGGMGVVYRARNVLMDRDEVLKVVGKRLLDKAGAADRFLREIRAAAKLAHPHVVAAYAAQQLGDLLVFAMEYVDGEDLGKVMRGRGPLPVRDACLYASHAALGLQHAHDRGMVHRDIKPSNLILASVDGRPVVKVLDFGLAKATSEKEAGRLTGDGQMMGTPDFMAPEQARDAAQADIRADVYSLGCTLFCLLTGDPPFRGGNLTELLVQHQKADPPSVAEVRPDVPADLAAILARLMAKDPAARHQTPGGVAKELARFAAAGPRGTVRPGRPFGAGRSPPRPAGPVRPPTVIGPSVVVSRPPTPEPLELPSRWRPWRVPAAVAGVVLLAVAAAVAGGVFKAKTKHGTIVVENVPADATVEVDGQTVTVSRNGETATLSPVIDGDRRVKVVKGGVEVWSQDVTVKLGGDPVRVRMEPPAGPPIPPAAGVKPKDEWVSLFNGKDKTGWQEAARNQATWRVEDGALVGRGSPDKLCWIETIRGDYGNFRLRANLKHGDDDLKCFDLRMTSGGPAITGYRIVLTEKVNGRAQYQPGSLVTWRNTPFTPDERGRPPEVPANIPVGGWYWLEVTADRGTITVSIDGRQIHRFVDPSPIPSGQIAFGGFDLYCRAMEIQELKGGAPAAPQPAEVFGPEGSEWVGIFTGQVGGKASQNAAAVTFIERSGTAFKMHWRTGAGGKRVIDGTIDANGRLTFKGVRAVLPDEKPRSTLTGTGEVQTNKMTLAWENPETGWIAQGVFKRLPRGGAGFHFPGRWHVHHEPNNWNGVRRVGADRLTTDRFPGDGPWERDGGLIITHYPGGGREWLVIDPDDPNTLTGSNGSQTITWTRQ